MNSNFNWLNTASNIATVGLAVVAVGAYAWYQLDLLMRRDRLEKFLKAQVGKRSKDDTGRHTVLYLASQLRMTEAEILEAGFKSKKLKCVPGYNKERDRTEVIYFEYDHKNKT
jgi:hypothetical protein